MNVIVCGSLSVPGALSGGSWAGSFSALAGWLGEEQAWVSGSPHVGMERIGQGRKRPSKPLALCSSPQLEKEKEGSYVKAMGPPRGLSPEKEMND